MFDATPIYETECLTTKPANVRKLIAWLEEGRGPKLNMCSIFNPDSSKHGIPKHAATNDWCGTSACLIGHTLILAHADGINIDTGGDKSPIAAEYLGIDYDHELSLFGSWESPYSIAEAIGKLEALLEPV